MNKKNLSSAGIAAMCFGIFSYPLFKIGYLSASLCIVGFILFLLSLRGTAKN